MDLLCSHIGDLHDHLSSFVNQLLYLCKIAKSRERYITKLLQYMESWMTSEKELISLEYLQKLIGVVSGLTNYAENVEYMGLIQCCWKFIYAACKRYPEWKLLLKQPPANLSGARLWMARAMLDAVIRGATISNSEIRSCFRPLVYSILPDGLFQRLVLLFSYPVPEKWQGQIQIGASMQWLPWLVDVLLTSLMEAGIVQLGPSMHRLPVLPIQFTAMDVEAASSGSSNSLLSQLLPLLRRSASLPLPDLASNLIELAYGDSRIAYKYSLPCEFSHCRLWVDLFPLAWRSFSASQQIELTHCIVKFMSSDSHQRTIVPAWEELDHDFKQWGSTCTLPYCQQAKSRYGDITTTHGSQALLEGIMRCEPLPRLPPILLLHLTRYCGCGPQASVLLERLRLDCASEKEKRSFTACLESVYVE